jgi:hypothetical protein
MAPLLIVPSGDEELVSDAETLSGAAPLEGLTDKAAVGVAGEAVTFCVAEAVAPTLSMTVAVTVNVPGEL